MMSWARSIAVLLAYILGSGSRMMLYTPNILMPLHFERLHGALILAAIDSRCVHIQALLLHCSCLRSFWHTFLDHKSGFHKCENHGGVACTQHSISGIIWLLTGPPGLCNECPALGTPPSYYWALRL